MDKWIKDPPRDILKQLIEMSRETDRSQITITIINKQAMVVMQDIVSIDKDKRIMQAMVKTSGKQYDSETIVQCVHDLLAANWQAIELPISMEYAKQIDDAMENQLELDIDKPPKQ